MRHILGIVIGFIAVPGSAQDMPGALNLPNLAQAQTQSSMMRGHAERDYARQRGSTLSPSSRRICAAAPRMERLHGSDHPKVRGLYATCRSAGYRY